MRRLLKVLGVLVLLLVIGAGAAIAFLPTERIARIAADQVKSATGRDLTLAGGLSPSIYPVLGVQATDVALSNPDWAEEPTMISAASVKIGVELMPLISGQIKVSEIRLIDPVIALEVAEDGRASWDFAPGAAAEDAAAEDASGDGESFIKEVSLGEATIENGLVRYSDRASGQIIQVAEINATAALEALDAPFSLAGDALWNGEKAEIELVVETIDAAIKGREIGIDFALASPRASVSYEGGVTPPNADTGPLPAVNGVFSAAADDPGGAIAWATAAPAPEALAGLSALKVDGTFQMNADGAAVDINGGATRNERAATVALKATGGPDWAQNPAFDIDLAASIGDLARVAYRGDIVAGGEMGVGLKGVYEIASSDPAAAAAWATGAAPEGLAGLSNLDFAGDVDMGEAGLAATAKGGVTRDGARATLDLSAKSGPDWATRRAFDVALAAALGNLGTAEFTGAAAFPGDAPVVDGRLKVNAPDLRGLAAFAGAALPASRDDAFRTLSVDAAVSTPEAGRAAISLASLKLDAIEAKGDVSVSYGGPLAVTANLTTNKLGLHPYMAGTESGPSGPGWSKEPIDLSGLGAITGDFTIRAAGVSIPPKIELGRSDIRAKLNGGRLDLNIKELGVYGGGVQGDIAVDGRNGNALSANVSASAIKMLPMLQALADLGLIEGVGRMNLNVAGGGASLHDIMNSLNGDGSIKLTDGAIVGYNLAAMVRNVTSAFQGGGGGVQKTDFSEVSSTFTIRNGVVNTADFSLLGPLIRVVGAGDVDIGGQSMNFRVTPKAVASLKGQGGSVADKGLAFPVIVSGPWSNLSFTPDLSAGISSIIENPEGAINAAKDLIKDGGGAAQAVKDIVKDGGAKKVIEEAVKGGDAEKIIEGLTGGGGDDNPVGGLLKGLFKN